MADDRGGASGGNGSKSYKDTLKEYKAFYEERHGGGSKSGFSNSRSSKRADDPYFDNKKPAGHYMAPPAMQRPQPSYQMKEERGWDWKEQNQWNNKIHNPQKAPPGLLPPRTAPDTPNIARQQIENSWILSDRAKNAARESNISSQYKQDAWAGGWFESAGDGTYYLLGATPWEPRPRGNLIMAYNDPTGRTAAHETIHASQFSPVTGKDRYGYTRSGKSIAADTQLLADQGYRWAQETVGILEDPNGFYRGIDDKAKAGEYQAFNAGGDPNPAEVPPWFREKHFSNVWSPEAMAAVPPPRPTTSPIQAPPIPQASSTTLPRMMSRQPMDMGSPLLIQAYLDEIRRQSEFPVRWR